MPGYAPIRAWAPSAPCAARQEAMRACPAFRDPRDEKEGFLDKKEGFRAQIEGFRDQMEGFRDEIEGPPDQMEEFLTKRKLRPANESFP